MSKRRGFTLIELLVVISLIALMIAILMPTLGTMRDAQIKTQCMKAQSQIVLATTTAANDQDTFYIPARNNRVQKALNPPETLLFVDYGFPWQMWFDPGRDYTATFEPWISNQLVIGYQYFGGITAWQTHRGTYETYSPVNLEQSKSGYAMSACSILKIEGEWGGGRETAFANMPSHHVGDFKPIGGNQSFADGSARWVHWREMTMNHTWWLNARKAFWYQDDMGEYEAVATPAETEY